LHAHLHTGYVSGKHFKMLGGQNWVANVMLTAVLWFGPVLAMFMYLNTVAIFYGVRAPALWLAMLVVLSGGHLLRGACCARCAVACSCPVVGHARSLSLKRWPSYAERVLRAVCCGVLSPCACHARSLPTLCLFSAE